MKSKLFIAALAMTISGLVFAQTNTVFGVPDCGEWVTQKQTDRAWLLGFLSGLNQDNVYKDPLDKVSSAAQIFLWMDNYCKNNPLEKVTKGAFRLFGELLFKK